ncbi:MAG: nucleotidyltransferase family protein [Thermoanaerobaculia bacterium]
MTSDPPAGTTGPVAGLLLAAGLSTRMGSNKLLLELDGESLVRRAARRVLAANLSPLVVVVGHDADSVRRELADLDCRFVFNPDFPSGAATSLRAGIAALPADCDAVVVVLADMPRVTSEMIAAVAKRYRSASPRVVASAYGGVHAPPVLYDARLFAELRALSGGRFVERILTRHRQAAEIVDWPSERLADIDRPEDVERLRAARPPQ